MFNKLKKIIALVLIGTLVLSTSLYASSDKKGVEKSQGLKVISIERYNEMNASEKEVYIKKYAKTLEKEMNRQFQENKKSIIDELRMQKGTESSIIKLEKSLMDYQVNLDLTDDEVIEKLIESFEQPVNFSEHININSNITDANSLMKVDDTVIQSSTLKSGEYLEQYKNDYVWYSGRSVSLSLYQKTWTSQVYFKGSYYSTYDIENFIFSWSGNSSYKDRVQSIVCDVSQADGRTGEVDMVEYNTGWPEHYYTGSFSKTGTALNLSVSPACIVQTSGRCTVGNEATVSFGDGSYTTNRIINSGYGGVNY